MRREELEHELRRQRLPAAYVGRLLSELDDHYEDLVEERSTSMGAARKLQTEQENWDQRMGNPAQLAVFAAEQYPARSFWGRHPLMTFVFGPLPMLLAGWFAAGFGVVWAGMGLVYVLGHWFGLSQEMARPQDHILAQSLIMCVVSWFIVVIPPLTLGA